MIYILFFSILDSTPIRQEIFFSTVLNKYGLVTNNGSLYDNVIHGDTAYLNKQKSIEFEKAWRKRKPIAIIKIKCNGTR